MTVTELIAAFLSGTLTYPAMTPEQRLQLQLYAAQGGFRGTGLPTL